MKILVFGGRDFRDEQMLFSYLDGLQAHFADGNDELITCVVTGAARGADWLAERWARQREIAYRGHPAPWHTHGAPWCRCRAPLPLICKGAGMWRNAEMLRREHVPSFPIRLAVAFPGGAGTAGMARLCREAGIRVREVPHGS